MRRPRQRGVEIDGFDRPARNRYCPTIRIVASLNTSIRKNSIWRKAVHRVEDQGSKPPSSSDRPMVGSRMVVACKGLAGRHLVKLTGLHRIQGATAPQYCQNCRLTRRIPGLQEWASCWQTNHQFVQKVGEIFESQICGWSRLGRGFARVVWGGLRTCHLEVAFYTKSMKRSPPEDRHQHGTRPWRDRRS